VLDLDLWATMVSALRAVGRDVDAAAAAARARAILETRAAQIDDAAIRSGLLGSQWARTFDA
jgi:hypothetical protein